MTAPGQPAAAEERLRDIKAITDAALSRLDDQEFLTELMARVKAVLSADTAAVLLLDQSSGQLVLAAAAGLDDDLRSGVRITVGQGFAGRIAADRRPVVIGRGDEGYPALLTTGIQSLLGVPLIAADSVIGVLHIGSLAAREFTAEDTELLQLAADRAAVAVQSQLTRADLAACGALQRSLLPFALPEVEGAEIAGRYVPGQGVVGGDWYDVFTLPTGELAAVIGDVAGSGLQAAVVMGRLRSALRAYSLVTRDPAEVLSMLDRKMAHFQVDTLASVLYAVFDRPLDQVRISSAGHLPPVVALPGQPAAVTAVVPDLMIGVDPAVPRRVTAVKITPGALLCLCTDGLIERPDEAIDDGLDRLCQAVTAQPADAACASVMGALVASEPTRDDIALLTLRRQPL
jgi:serine phosphatase RsbU (regulator of sigma subunit)